METSSGFGEEEEEGKPIFNDFHQEAPSSPSASSSSSYSHKLVPWLSWDEWLFVKDCLFSNSPDSVATAFRRISAWRSRGCLPVAIEVTASIIEIQQKDPHFRENQSNGASDNFRVDQTSYVQLSEDMLAMLYCMAIIRLVNGVVEKTRKKTEVSLAVAADAIGIPRMLIDIRHEGSHRELPALQIVRSASLKVADILNYPVGVISFSRLWLASTNHQNLEVTKNLKVLVRLYSSFSSEFASMLLEFLLKAKISSDTVELPEDSQLGPSIHTMLDDWKLVITKLSNKEPELLLALLKAVLDRIETQEAMKYETAICQIEHLSSLFAWLVERLKELKPRCHKDSTAEIKASSREAKISKTILLEVLHKCLLVSASGNKHLMDSAVCLAQLMGDRSLMEKLNKLSLNLSNTDFTEEEIPSMTNLLTWQEQSISQAAEKLELVKLHRMKSKVVEATGGDMGNSKRWVVSRSWNPCPIGMLPHTLGMSGLLPVLERKDDRVKVPEVSEQKEENRCSGKREASSDIQQIDNSSVKKRREKMEVCESDTVDALPFEGVKGHLMIGGIWKEVREDELFAIMSDVRILV
ncbi:ribosomal biogenesis protein las1l [Quercus suber]|uniref:Ribosomal biogenesis protein las1l n=1 Tax=Quercus suber TaxID=58331 RepID=A0AAW0K0V4_QUESU